MKLAIIQMKVGPNKAENLQRASALALEAKGADVIMLPEMFCCPYENSAIVRSAEAGDGETAEMLSQAAKASGAYVIGGSMPEKDGEKLFNTCLIHDPSGRLIAKHRKAHLFDVDIKCGQRYKESDTFSAGDGITVFDTPFGRFGVCICFDIRFSSFIHEMKDIDFLAVPAAFNMTTGPLHWELLFRARAVDEQIFTFGCAPARDESAKYVSYGNSIAVSPWGKVIVRAGLDETVLTVSVDPNEVREIRTQIPIGKI